MPNYLIVDDSPAVRMVLAEAIRKARLQHLVPMEARVVEAIDPKSALIAFQRHDFEAVFLDIMLVNGKGGLAALTAMLETHPGAVIIVTTSLERNDEQVVQALSRGAFAYLQKPIRVETVAGVLTSIDAERGRLHRVASARLH